MSALLMLAFAAFAASHVRNLVASGMVREAWGAASLWLLSLGLALQQLLRLPLPSPLYGLELMFSWLSVALRSW